MTSFTAFFGVTTMVGRVTLVVLAVCLFREFGHADEKPSKAAYSRQSDVVYGRKHGLAMRMEVLTPDEPNGFGIIWVVSSSGVSRRDKTFRTGFIERVKPFLERGYQVFAVIHSSSPRFHVQDYAADVRRAIRFIKFNCDDYGINPKKLGISGSSSGGYIALLVSMDRTVGEIEADDPIERVDSDVGAVGCFFPLTDLLNFGRHDENFVDFMQRRYGTVPPAFTFFKVDAKGGRSQVSEHDEVARMLGEFSPITKVSSDDPPTMLIHGDADRTVSVDQSYRMIEQLKTAEVPNRLVVRKGKPHAWEGWETDSKLLVTWFNQHLAEED